MAKNYEERIDDVHDGRFSSLARTTGFPTTALCDLVARGEVCEPCERVTVLVRRTGREAVDVVLPVAAGDEFVDATVSAIVVSIGGCIAIQFE